MVESSKFDKLIREGDLAAVKALLETSAGRCSPDIILFAALRQEKAIQDYLLEQMTPTGKIDINKEPQGLFSTCDGGGNILHALAERAHTGMTYTFSENRTVTSENGKYQASRSNEVKSHLNVVDWINYFLARGADPAALNDNDNPPFAVCEDVGVRMTLMEAYENKQRGFLVRPLSPPERLAPTGQALYPGA